MLNDIISVSGLLLTLATFLFNLAWPKISHAINLEENVSGDHAKKRFREEIDRVILTAILPILIAFMLLFYVNLPSAFKIIASSKLVLWDFDPGITLYIFVVYALLALLVFNFYLFFRLIGKRRKCK
ncbi:hypothetical protein [Salinivibrio kushneri]|uniref:hypothetical protein n=1 Tax=Salinivibrio kushneri TaxID=1908198 RepID=UPI00098584C2|nr:hypothetical protein [Salinivibrio kushneri]OOE33439.1 hypothetical protein BZG05_10400 [Salinivibrio kushneri]OOE48437.1 hypothetical protein BZG11_14760 [Salinivibrio kushneri]OOE49136.1 hypothetical protein BZG10_09970 [Salinivibrio kushneri]OOE57912.1 hypothetical protein BZG18_15550 [Salinivibrio kushneri]